jgi:ATP-dependent protease HslVU (ClpYQ) peptidase subunit
MTCVVGVAHGGKVYMGADSQGSSGWDKREVLYPKVFNVGQFLIGFTTSFRMGQLLQYQLEVKPQGNEDDYAYMVTAFVESVRELLKNSGWAKVENNQEEGGNFLVGYKGRLYEIQTDMSVLEHADGFDAVGCGRKYALAAVVALKDKDPRVRIYQALEIAELFSNGVGGPFVVLGQE